LTQRELAERAGLGLRTLVHFENEERQLTPSGMIALEKVLSDQGIQLINEPDFIGVKVRRPRVVLPSAEGQTED
jgi:transcriptional regulator with XRE-family HTH domain